ncbi:MAG: endonuclease, partial [Bacilli bacterium]|nr:endonuclease [Bacilli bacterium]
SFKSYDFEFDSTNTIEISATNRCYISSIELFYSKETKVFTLDNLTLGDLSNVTTDIELPSTHEGYVVSWSSSDEDVVTSTGRVTRFLDDKEVILTATCNGLTKDFNVTVKGNRSELIIITDEGKTQYSSYYSSIDNSLSLGMNGTFCSRLTTLLYPKDFYTYKGSNVGQTGYELIALNEDPSNPDNMIMFYTQDSIKKEVSGDGTWNREHVWCQSLSYATEYGKDELYGTTKGGVDILHLMPTYRNVNSTRNNRRYDEIPSGEEKYFNNCYYGKIGKEDNFEPRDDVKGDAARICLYMWVVYLKAHGSKITNVATSLEMLVRWSNEDKPSQIEKNRNNLAQKGKQKNRNPFVDHPEWVNYIFGAEYNA